MPRARSDASDYDQSIIPKGTAVFAVMLVVLTAGIALIIGGLT